MTNVDLITKLISMETGYAVEMFGTLAIHRLEDGRYGVYEEPKEDRSINAKWSEKLFTDPKLAAEEFERVRINRELGFEFEKGEGIPVK